MTRVIVASGSPVFRNGIVDNSQKVTLKLKSDDKLDANEVCDQAVSSILDKDKDDPDFGSFLISYIKNVIKISNDRHCWVWDVYHDGKRYCSLVV